jgi:DNA-binding transcriptional ArsR family regulator
MVNDESQNTADSSAPRSKNGRPKGKATDRDLIRDKRTFKILSLHERNLAPADIARATGVPQSTVSRTLKRFGKVFKELKNVRDFRDGKAEILSAAQLAILKATVTDGKLKKASLLNGARAFEILNKAERLELGQSTDNVAHHVFGRLDLHAVSNGAPATSPVVQNCSLKEGEVVDITPSPLPRDDEKKDMAGARVNGEQGAGGLPADTPDAASPTGTPSLLSS